MDKDNNKSNANQPDEKPPDFNQSSNADYYFDENGLLVFTAQYHLNRGYCCKNGCRHCPYDFNKK